VGAALQVLLLTVSANGQETTRVSVDSAGAEGNDYSHDPAISADGQIVAFQSNATNLVAGDTNGASDAFVHDRSTGLTERVSVDSSGAEANSYSYRAAISADERSVAFHSFASNLVSGDTNGTWDIFVHDRSTGLTERVSVDTTGTEGNDKSSDLDRPVISSDGRYVAFSSLATNLVAGDTNAKADVFLRDRQLGTTARVNVDSGGAEADDSGGYPSISSDGLLVAFTSSATNLVAGDTNATNDAFVRDRALATTERVNLGFDGREADGPAFSPSISADGRYVAFESDASNLVPGDTNGVRDVFVRDRDAAGFASLCDPGVKGVITCPCSNPPASLARGCDNSAATGGANLSAAGIAYLSMDGLVFTTSGEKPTALSIVMQGNGVISSG
jgi:Tol biopolymer transport system component